MSIFPSLYFVIKIYECILSSLLLRGGANIMTKFASRTVKEWLSQVTKGYFDLPEYLREYQHQQGVVIYLYSIFKLHQLEGLEICSTLLISTKNEPGFSTSMTVQHFHQKEVVPKNTVNNQIRWKGEAVHKYPNMCVTLLTDQVQLGLFYKHLRDQFIESWIKSSFHSEYSGHCPSQIVRAGDIACI